MKSHFSRNMGQHPVLIRQLDPKHGVRKQLDDSAFYFNCVFPRHVRISGPSFVISTVCSKWADRVPSAVRTVHPSSRRRTSGPPMLIIGSIASVIPPFNFGPLPRRPKFGVCGFFVILRPTL